MQRAFWGRINGFLNRLVFTRWTSQLAICPLDSLIRPRKLSTNQEEANVRPYHIQSHLGLGLQLDNMAHTISKPRPHTNSKPIEQMIFINSYHAMPPGSHSVTCLPNKKVIAWLYCLSVARQCLGNITAEHIYWSGNHFQSHSHHTPLPPNTHLRLTTLDLILH